MVGRISSYLRSTTGAGATNTSSTATTGSGIAAWTSTATGAAVKNKNDLKYFFLNFLNAP